MMGRGWSSVRQKSPWRSVCQPCDPLFVGSSIQVLPQLIQTCPATDDHETPFVPAPETLAIGRNPTSAEGASNYIGTRSLWLRAFHRRVRCWVEHCGPGNPSSMEGYVCFCGGGFHGHRPLISTCIAMLKKVRISTRSARTPTFSSVGATTTVRMMSPATRNSRARRMDRPKSSRNCLYPLLV